MREVTVLKGGRTVPCGKLIHEDSVLVWERRVSKTRHLFRVGRARDGSEVRDAWTLGAMLLAQLRALGVERIRYICGPDIYEISMRDFLQRAKELDQSDWQHTTEAQWALPRKLWEKRESAQKQLALQI